jgi:hypothetical protein
MKLKKMLLGPIGVALLLASCGGENVTPSTQKPSESSVSTQDTQPVTSSMLDGVVTNGKVRVDIMNDNLGARFSYGNEAIVSSKEMTYNSTSTLTISGTANVDINFIIVIQNSETTVISYYPAINKEDVAEWLSDVKFDNALRVYVAISSGTPNWTKGLNTSLDTALNARVRN